MKVIESKSILAKLLATENISVEHQKVSTAAFDVKNRKLILPTWENMSNSLYDLLLGHEVGHARFTPPEGWHDAVCDEPAKKGFLNVLEDVRIERFIKKQYPGLVKSFYSGYRELFDRDFFGVANTEVDTLPLIDRINLHYKIGSFLNVQFTDAEKAILKRLEAAETWDEIAALADELYVSAKEEKEQEPERGGGSSDEEDEQESGEGEGEQESGDAADDQESDDDEFGEEGDDATDGDISDIDDDFSTEEDTEQVSVMEEYTQSEEPYSITDEAFREKEDQLVDNSEKKSTRYINIPKLNPDTFIVSSKTLYGNLEDSFQRGWGEVSIEDKANEMYADFKRKNISIVNNMIQQFERKRKASENLKARVSKTGDLNEDRLWAYKISEDLFKQSTILPKGKNHGMIMFLDMSGSMVNQIKSTIEQMLTLVMFCQKINVPFDVYGFTNTGSNSNADTATEGDLVIDELNMPHLFSSSFNKLQTVNASKHLLLLGEFMSNRYGCDMRMSNRNFNLGATPLNSAMIAGIEIAKRFRETHKVEILNTIVLTDGGATDVPSYATGEISSWSGTDRPVYRHVSWSENVVFKYGSVSIGYDAPHSRYYSMTASALELYKQVTGSTLINYHLMQKWTEREFVDVYNDYYRIDNPKFEYNNAYDVWSKERKDGVVEVKDPVGFDARFIMKSSKIDIEDEELTVKSNSKGDLLRGFRKFAGNKRGQRIFVNKFMDLVA
tara:strand:+ start:1908 stop:4088 length:2181 start_codon:yes stop_codon:yes gene_type:complete